MTRHATLKHEFVDYIPESLDEGVIYVCIQFATIVHRCACGCGHEVVTPLSPTDWKLIFDGQTISLDPSIGNWSFACQSHYWIRRNKVVWARSWTRGEIEKGRAHDRVTKDVYFAETGTEPPQSQDSDMIPGHQSLWQRLKASLFGRRTAKPPMR